MMASRQVSLLVALPFLLSGLSSAFVVSPFGRRPTAKLATVVVARSSSPSDSGSSTTTHADDDNNIITLGLFDDGESDFIDTLLKHETLGMMGVEVETLTLSTPEKFEAQVGRVDAACFPSPDAVVKWLKWCNDAGNSDNVDVIAVCMSKDTANACLQSEKWESRNIYYPKGAENADIGPWVDSAVQALGDIMERKFWGGGW